MWYLLLSLALFTSVPLLAADSSITPESIGLTALHLSTPAGRVDYFVSTEALKAGPRKPLFVFIQGSGPQPLFEVREQDGRRMVRSSMMIRPKTVAADFWYVVLSKPGIPFLLTGPFTPPPEYWQRTSLPARADSVNAVIAHLLSQPGVDGSRVVVAGHSEGASVAARVAATNRRITDVVFLSSDGESQMYGFVLDARKRQARGELTPAATDAEIQNLMQKFHDIHANPDAIDKFWMGHTYLRWSTFFQPAVDNLLKTNARVFVGTGTADTNVPVESTEVIPLEFLRAGKHNLTFRTWPGLDHSYSKEVIAPDGSHRREDHLPEVLAEVMEWVQVGERAVNP
jgi:pimeloyl-ACP methyl ester carboxylesterase